MSARRSRWMVLTALFVTAAIWLVALGSANAAVAASASWQYAPAVAPPPPQGVSPSPFPTELGPVGDIEFWSPNQGLLITGGTGVNGSGFVPAGLYAYDGVSWHLLSTVCGSGEGRIAYVSADEWWTISDQQPGIGVAASGGNFDAVSLCHFVGGQVVGSYAVPVDQPNSYPEMDAAACAGSNDCWFAGGFSGTTGGAFHLYWNGQTLSEVDDSGEAHAVSSMAVSGGEIYEGVTISPTDSWSPGEDQAAPAVVHTIDPDDGGDPFQDVTLGDFACSGYCPTLPNYGTGTTPDEYGGWMLWSDDGSVANPASPGQIWALAAPPEFPSGNPAQTLALQESGGNWSQIAGPGALTLPTADGTPAGIVAVPGQEQAWVPINGDDGGGASLDLLSSSDGGQTWTATADSGIGPAQGVGDLGGAGPVACPAANDCWMATSEGWLFQWTDGTSYGQSTDPVYDGGIGIITYRPPDDGVPDVPGTTAPPDDSLANQAPPQVIVQPIAGIPAGSVALVSDEKASVIKGTDKLRFTFKLRARARVQLLALRKESTGSKKSKPGTGGKPGKGAKSSKSKLVTVARSKLEVLGKGKRSLIVKLNPKKWPTTLKLNATPVTAAGAS